MKRKPKPKKDKFAALMDKARETAKAWGYKTKREQAIYVNGFVRGISYVLSDCANSED